MTALERIGTSAPTTAIVVDESSPIGTLADQAIALPMAAKESVVQTVFPTTTLVVLRAAVGEALEPIVSAAGSAVSDELPIDPTEYHQFTFLGLGWAAAIADEAALTCREAAGVWTESYPAMEYRHGPISVSGPGGVVWAFGTLPPGLPADVEATGARFVRSDDDPLVDLIRAQRVAVALAEHHGRDPDHRAHCRSASCSTRPTGRREPAGDGDVAVPASAARHPARRGRRLGRDRR